MRCVEGILFWLAVATLVVLVAGTIEMTLGRRAIRHLRDQEPVKSGPKVSVIVSARNEARKIEPALRSLLQLDYPNIEFSVVNDRSTDETGAILDRFSGIKVVHIRELPKGWLGKNHAQQTGAEHATGELLLFTDADVHMESSVISRAVGCMQASRLDHLALAPQVTMPGTLLEMFAGTFTIMFGIYAKPWKAPDPKSARHIGIGAFNLIRADVYRAIGGHAKIAMRPDDDMKLGKLVKMAGGRQEMLMGDGLLTVEWYSSVHELMHGLEKNSFAGVEYNLALLVAATIAQLVAFVWPVTALFVTTAATWWLNVAILAVTALFYAGNAREHGLKRWHCVGFPLMCVLFLLILWRATLKTLINDGIDWRGTHYSLAELKANKI